jgi:hypothetical protein
MSNQNEIKGQDFEVGAVYVFYGRTYLVLKKTWQKFWFETVWLHLPSGEKTSGALYPDRKYEATLVCVGYDDKKD